MYRIIIDLSIFCTEKSDAMSKKVIPRGRGRPKTNPTSIHLTLLPDQLARLDAFIAAQDDELSRAEGVRRLLDEALTAAEKGAKRKDAR
jgi:hypothetical protein